MLRDVNVPPIIPLGRLPYLLWGMGLVAIKHNVDRAVAFFFFDRPWFAWNYLFPDGRLTLEGMPEKDRLFFAALALLAIPFVAAGVWLTLRRIRSIGWPLWTVVFFFLPVLNLLFFALLCVLPERGSESASDSPPTCLGKMIPRSSLGSAVLAVFLTATAGTILTQISVRFAESYGWGLFFALPFGLGLGAALLASYHQRRKCAECVFVAVLAATVVGGSLLAFALEGLICVLMAAPLGYAMAIFGALAGYAIQSVVWERRDYGKIYCTYLVGLPLLMLAEGRWMAEEAPQRRVTTQVIVHAEPEKVWPAVVSFSRIAEPKEWIFRTGIAYPIEARIEGKGAGAIRHCVFSTGSFVEPIQVWDEPRRLAFDVTAQPPPMREISPYADIHPPHLEGYMISEHGEFRLTSLSDGRTLLEGTTWYRHRLWPQTYWGGFSDYLIHSIHRRVLEHIRNEVE